MYRCHFAKETEDKGFEPSHRLTGLTHFECAPFDHLGNPPYCLRQQHTLYGNWIDCARVISVTVHSPAKRQGGGCLYNDVVVIAGRRSL